MNPGTLVAHQAHDTSREAIGPLRIAFSEAVRAALCFCGGGELDMEEDGLWCPVCATWYSEVLGEGSECGDFSQGQPWPCKGRLVPYVDQVIGLETQRRARMSREAVVQFFKDGNVMSVRTTATTPVEFLTGCAEELGTIIDSGRFRGDWQYQLDEWLPQIVELACKLKGYKAEVTEYRVLIAGTRAIHDEDRVTPSEEGLAALNDELNAEAEG